MPSFAKKLLNLVPGRAKRFTAVDFDSRQMRIVLAEHVGNRTRILKLTQIDMPPEMDLGSAAAVGEFLGRTIKDLGLGGTGVLMNLPRGQAVLKPLTLPPGTPRSELAGMVQFQVEKELPFRVEEAVIDFTVASHFDAGTGVEAAAPGVDVLVAAVRLPVVDYYRQIAEAANVDLLRLGLRPYASVQCLDACTRRDERESVAIVNMTADETEINVVVGGSLAFSRSAVLSITPPRGGSDPAIKETVETLVTEVTRSLQSYQAVQGGRPINAVLVAGGTGVESRVAQHLAQHLGVQCELFHPGGVLGIQGDVPGTSAFMAAVGLAIGHHSASLPFDFLSPKRPAVQRDLRKIRLVGAAAIAGLVLLTVVVVISSRIATKRARLNSLKAEYGKLREENKKVKAMGKRVEAVDDWLKDSRNWVDHWAYLSSLFPSCQEAYISDIKVSRTDGSISFTVKARDSEVIAALGARLRDAGYDFKPGQAATGKDRYGYLHSTEVKVPVPRDMEVNLANVRWPPRPSDDASLEQFLRPQSWSVKASPGEGDRHDGAVSPRRPTAPRGAEAASQGASAQGTEARGNTAPGAAAATADGGKASQDQTELERQRLREARLKELRRRNQPEEHKGHDRGANPGKDGQ